MEYTLKNLYELFASHPEGSWRIRPENAKELYSFVKKNPIKRVLDLGTGIGCSPAVIALALKDKGETGYEIHTVESFEKCVNLAKELIPKELQENITFHQSDPFVWQTELVPYQHFSTFKELPEGEWDLIMVDGPGPFPIPVDHIVDLPNGDVMKLLIEEKLKPGTLIAWDGRLSALKTLERYFGSNFYLTYSGDGNDFNVIERKDNPVLCEDVKWKSFGDYGYLKGVKRVYLKNKDEVIVTSKTPVVDQPFQK